MKQTHENTIAQLTKKLEEMNLLRENTEKEADSLRKLSSDQTFEQKSLSETIQLYEEKLDILEKQLEEERASHEHAREQIESLKKQLCEQKTSQVVNFIQ